MSGCPLLDSEYAARKNGKRLPCERLADENERLRGTCRDVCAGISEFTCSSCGFSCDLTSWISLFDGEEGRHRHHHHGTPNYCPNCGRRVEP